MVSIVFIKMHNRRTETFMREGVEGACHRSLQLGICVVETQTSRCLPRLEHHGHDAIGDIGVRPTDYQCANESTLPKYFVKHGHHATGERLYFPIAW